MGRIPKGAPAKGVPPKGSWGDGYVIESTQHSKRVSCSSCIHYRNDDKSCDIKPIYVPENGYSYWKTCNCFELSPEFTDDTFYIKVVQRIKGIDYIPQKKLKKKESSIAEQEIFTPLSQKHLYKLALQCPYFNKYNNHCKQNNEAAYCSVIRRIKNDNCMMKRRIKKIKRQFRKTGEIII